MIQPLATRIDPVAFARRTGAVLVAGTGQVVGTLDAFAAALDFPDHFGHNLDAMLDCLRELDPPPVIVWSGAGRLLTADPAGYRALLAVLRCWEREEPAMRVLLAGPG